jgi:thiol:disulfide interchange protein DsbC
MKFLRKHITLLFVFLFLLVSSGLSYGLTPEEAKETLKAFGPNVKIISVKKAPVEGLWEVIVESGHKKGILYIDDSRNYLFNGSIYDLKSLTNLTKKKYDEITRVDFSQIPLKDSIILGNPKAQKKVVVFDDPDCPYCAKLHPELKKITEERKDIAFYIKMFPLVKLHPKAYEKSKAILCQDSNDKSLKLLEDAFAKKELPKPTCETKAVDETISLGTKLGITGTPSLIFQNGRKISGALDAKTLKKLIDQNS